MPSYIDTINKIKSGQTITLSDIQSYPTSGAAIDTSKVRPGSPEWTAHVGLQSQAIRLSRAKNTIPTDQANAILRQYGLEGFNKAQQEYDYYGKFVSPDLQTAATNIKFPGGVSVPEDKTGAPTTGVAGDITQPVTNKKFQESDIYKNLSPEEKETADLLFNVISVGGEAEARTFADAIQQAIGIADPWAKAQGALLLAEFAGSVDETIFGFEAKTEAIQRARDILSEDVTSQKEFLSLEQQSEIAKQTRQYDEDLLSIADQAAEKGITFATGARSRALAEERRGEQFQDVIQSSRRKTNFQIKELELKAARGDVEAQAQLDTLTGEQGFALRKIGRSAEEVLGSERAAAMGVGGFTPSGGVAGTLAEQREKRIISDVGGAVGLTSLLTEGV